MLLDWQLRAVSPQCVNKARRGNCVLLDWQLRAVSLCWCAWQLSVVCGFCANAGKDGAGYLNSNEAHDNRDQARSDSRATRDATYATRRDFLRVEADASVAEAIEKAVAAATAALEERQQRLIDDAVAQALMSAATLAVPTSSASDNLGKPVPVGLHDQPLASAKPL